MQEIISQVLLRSGVLTVLGCCLTVTGVVYLTLEKMAVRVLSYLLIMLFKNLILSILPSIFQQTSHLHEEEHLSLFKI